MRFSYRDIDKEGSFQVACCDVEGEECVATAVCVTGQDLGDSTANCTVLAQGEVHGQVQ